MHDLKYIRDNAAAFDAALARRGAEPSAEAILALDAKRREITTRMQEAQSRRNDASKLIGQAMGAGEKDKAEALKAEVAELKLTLPALEDGQWHAKFLGSKPDRYDSLIQQLVLGNDDDDDAQVRAHDLVGFAALHARDAAARAEAGLQRLLGGTGAQVYCLECPALAPPPARHADISMLTMFARLMGI